MYLCVMMVKLGLLADVWCQHSLMSAYTVLGQSVGHCKSCRPLTIDMTSWLLYLKKAKKIFF